MATFRNRHGKWQARAQCKGQKPVSKSFQSKEDAQRWARQVEAEIDRGSYANIALAEKTLLKDVKALEPITDVANKYRYTILIVTHNRKGKAETDPLEQVSGSLGLTDAVDGVMIIDGN